MKKYINTAFIYAVAGLAGGVFYREFTKFSGFSGRTVLSFVHLHLLVLGMLLFLLVALFVASTDVSQQKGFVLFYRLYNVGLPLTAVTLLGRGVVQVRGVALSKAFDAALSGVAGIGHILLGTGLVLLFCCLRRSRSAHLTV